MKFIQPELPYAADALEPVISKTTIVYHYGKHEKAYISALNELIDGTEYAEKPLEEIIRTATGPLFNNASQAWNHIFYFFQFSPDGRHEPNGELRDKIEAHYGSFKGFKEEFEKAGKSLFGSGWVWLSVDADDNLIITQGSNAETPLTIDGLTPLLTFDVWEHAYYIDYRNLRADYLHNLWQLVDWSIVENRYRDRM